MVVHWGVRKTMMGYFYIAAHSQNYAWLLKRELERRGHFCTSRWITDVTFGQKTDDDAKAAAAETDLADVLAGKDALVLLAENEGVLVPGGKHVEMGYALAEGYPIYVIGRRENALQWHPKVRFYSTVEGFLRDVSDEALETETNPHRP